MQSNAKTKKCLYTSGQNVQADNMINIHESDKGMTVKKCTTLLYADTISVIHYAESAA